MEKWRPYTWPRAQANHKGVEKHIFLFLVMSAFQNETLKINHCVNHAVPVSISGLLKWRPVAKSGPQTIFAWPFVNSNIHRNT